MRLAIFATLLLTVAHGHAANILAPIWFPGPSHFVVFRRLFKELAFRGHNVTVISHYPLDTPLKNYNDISIKDGVPMPETSLTMDLVEKMRTPFVGPLFMKSFCRSFCLDIFDLPQVRQLVNSNERYDLIISEYFHVDCMAVLSHRFKAPLVGISSSMAMASLHERFGNPLNPAYMEQYDLPRSAPFTFWGRLYSSILQLFVIAVEWWVTTGYTDKKIREIVGEDTPPLQQVLHNASLVLVNSHWSVDQPVPKVPAFVEVGGLHVEEPKPLPQNVQTFIEDSPHGVIYFSLGSMVESDSLPPQKIKAIVDAFGSVPQRVLWKCDPSRVPPLPSNVLGLKWIPQNDVLNHPNVRLFITHGGLLGTQEAIMAGVPVLTIALFADQLVNAEKAASSGYGIRLSYEDITSESLRSAIDALFSDTRYRDRAQQVSALFRDRPRPPLEEAVYWVEYVLRHGGAPHLRSAALDLAWYQYLLLDVAAFVVLAESLVVVAGYLLLRRVLSHFNKPVSSTPKLKKS